MKMDCLHVRSALSHYFRMKRLAKSILRYEDKQKITRDSVRFRLEVYSLCFSLSYTHTHTSRGERKACIDVCNMFDMRSHAHASTLQR